MKCPKCEFENPDGFKFCGECSHPLTEKAEASFLGTTTESERKQVTIMFSDLSGYTAMTEKLDPEEVKEIMSRIFGEITRIIKKYEGFIERFIGDAVMAVFGIPKAHEDDPVRAIRAALEIHAAVEDFSPQFRERIGRSLTMHTGINTGLVVTGEVDVEKGTHGLTGDAINLASRLEGLAKDGEIVVGPETYHLAVNDFEFVPLEPTQVKGKTESVSVYKVLSVLERHTATQRPHGLQAKLIGREPEMALLMHAVENLKQRKGSTISVTGHAGTGKSRLIQGFKDKLDPNQVQWHEGHAYPYTQNMAYYPLTNLFIHAFGIKEEDKPDQVREKIETGVEALIWDKHEVTQYLGSLFSLSYAEIDDVSPEFWRNQLHQSVQQILEAVAGRGPTIILFEDLHWADDAFIELLHLLLEKVQRPVLLLCIYRPSFSLFPKGEPDSLAWPHQKIDLKELPWDETEAMLQSLLDASQLPDELRYFIRQKVEGNPFYLEEVINTLIETGTLISDKGGWQVTRSLDLADVPTTIQGVLTARLDRLEKQAKRILQEASVIGRAFFYKVLTRITNLTTPVDGYLSGLENLDLIRARTREPELEYIFKHALTQEVVYNGLLKKERQEIHGHIGSAIEQIFTDRLPEFYETLAFHYKRGNSSKKAVDYLMRSGKKSIKRYALEESHQYYQEAFTILKEKADKTNQEKETLVDLLIQWAYVYYYKADLNGLIDLFTNNRDLAASVDDQAKYGMFNAWLGFGYWMSGEDDTGYHYLCKALDLGEKTGDQEVIGYACCWMTWNAAGLGLLDEVIRFGERAHAISKQLPSDRYIYTKTLGGVAFSSYFSGEINTAFEYGEKILAYGQKHSHVRSIAMGHISLGVGHIASGDFSTAAECLQKAIDVAQDPMYEIYAKAFLGPAQLLLGRVADAVETLREPVRFWREFGYGGTGCFAYAYEGVASIMQGEMDKGLKKIEEAIAVCKDNGRKSAIASLEFALGFVYLKMVQGEGPMSLSLLVKNIGFIIKNLPVAAKKSETHFNKAIELGKEIGARGVTGPAYLALGQLHKAKKRIEKAMPIRLTQVMVAFDSVLRIADRVEALTCRDF